MLFAVPASPYPVTFTQPDGSELSILLHGDEFFSYRTTLDGYLIIQDKEDGFFKYAEFKENNKIVNTKVQANNSGKRSAVEISFLEKLIPNQDLTKITSEIQELKRSQAAAVAGNPKQFPLNGNPKSLVILVSFSDLDFVVGQPKEAFTRLLNEQNYNENGGTGSARDYFMSSSNGVFNPEFVVVGPYTLPNPMSYYGENDYDGNDKRPTQMVADACRLAYEDGVDFSEYDTDNDGKVDNVFIYYAGHNEAEQAAANTIWPHRWVVYPGANYSGSQASVTFNGKLVYDYACTSELRASSGKNMCGIGTFVHEFGHVLGLPDFYATNGANHTTMSYWDVMDLGPYLNQGRTPPAYSSYERFFLGWLTPTLLTEGKNVNLKELNQSNSAYIIAEGDSHNLNGLNPSPSEFFMVENRQKSGWDLYLPGSGMLITRINYSYSSWWNNTVNNTKNKMGVEIISANGQRSGASREEGVTFPGASNIKTYRPVLRDNAKDINKPLTHIKLLSDGTVFFRFMGGEDIEAPVAKEASNVELGSFSANWEAVDDVSGYYLSVYSKEENKLNYIVENKWLTKTSFDIGNLASETEYYYTLKSAIRISDSSEDEVVSSMPSNEIVVKTKKDENDSRLRISKDGKGDVMVFLNPSDMENLSEDEITIYVYDYSGRMIRKIVPESTITTLDNLPKRNIYILRLGEKGKKTNKVIL